MIRALSWELFGADLSDTTGKSTRAAYTQNEAAEIGFKEIWLQNAIFQNPELVISPCREGELTDEDERWWGWAREFSLEDVGSIDVLLVSDRGRVAIVETKLSYNREGRRTVLAQLLDYAVHFSEEAQDRPLPPLPEGVSEHDVRQRIETGDFLLVIAGDRLDPRAVKLSRSLLGDHMLNAWELALVELAVFTRAKDAVGPEHLVVPHLRGVVEPESRQVVKVVVPQDAKMRVVLERQAPATPSSERQKWTQARFEEALATSGLPASYTTFLRELLALRARFPDLELKWGTGKTGSVVVKRNGHGLVEFYLDGKLWFRLERPTMALGQSAGDTYLNGLRELFPREMSELNPNNSTGVQRASAEARLDGLAQLLGRVLAVAQ